MPVRILLVDDSRIMRNIQKKSLESLEGARISARSGDGIEAVGRRLPAASRST